MTNIFFKFVLTLTLLLTFCNGIKSQVVPQLYKRTNNDEMKQWVDSVYNGMTIDQKVGQLFMMIIAGDNSLANINNLAMQVRDLQIGGILFSKISIQDHVELTNYAQKMAQIPLLVSLDGEWGLGMRIGNTTPWPRNMMLGAIQNDSLIFLYGREVARQCRVMGININFAPDIDVNTNPRNPVIGSRSFGENAERVGELGVAYSKGLESLKVLSVAKHFPGHGDTSTDSHHTLPLISHGKERLFNVELLPFRIYINAGLGGIMVGHLNIPAFYSSKQPSSLSTEIVTDLLQKKLGFEGLIFTDGMAMKGVSTEPNHSVRALLAGNDIVLSPLAIKKEIGSVKDAVQTGKISEDMLEKKVKKILSYKYILGCTSKQKTLVNAENIEARLNTPYANWLNLQLNANALTLLKNEGDILPLKNLDQRTIAAVSIGNSGTNYFLRQLKDYGNVTTFNVASTEELRNLKSKLTSFNTIIIGVHSRKVVNPEIIADIAKGKQLILSFFVYPYELRKFKSAIDIAKSVSLGYENSKLATELMAQSIYGGRPFKGKLPVTIEGMFEMGTGITTIKNRLAFGMPEEVSITSQSMLVLDSIVQAGIQQRAYPGAEVLVAKNGIVIYNKAFGNTTYNSGEKIDINSIYDIASMSKATGTLPAIMKLYDDSKIKLTDPISKYIDILRNTDKANITIREALFHETGLAGAVTYYKPALDNNSYNGSLFHRTQNSTYNIQVDKNTFAQPFAYKKELISKTPKPGFIPLADGLYVNKCYNDSILSLIASSKLRPNKKYLYSCLNFILLKEATEKITGMNLNEYTKKNFFSRLGATTTTYCPLETFDKSRIVPTENDSFLRKQLLRGYVHDEGAAFLGGISGNAGLFSNATDLAKLYQMYLNNGSYGGEEYISPSTMRTFTKTQSAKSRRGLGFDKPEPSLTKGSPASPSTPKSAYGHTGFTGTCFWIDPDNQLIFIFLCNRVNPNRYPNNLSKEGTRDKLQEQLYKAIYEGKSINFSR